jgi:hypothetical protein
VEVGDSLRKLPEEKSGGPQEEERPAEKEGSGASEESHAITRTSPSSHVGMRARRVSAEKLLRRCRSDT